MTANRGTFEPCLTPLFGGHEPVPHGIARLVAAQAAHLEDLTERRTRITGREKFIADAKRFVRSCASLGCEWQQIEPLLETACTHGRIELTFDEKQRLFESYFAATEELAA